MVPATQRTVPIFAFRSQLGTRSRISKSLRFGNDRQFKRKSVAVRTRRSIWFRMPETRLTTTLSRFKSEMCQINCLLDAAWCRSCARRPGVRLPPRARRRDARFLLDEVSRKSDSETIESSKCSDRSRGSPEHVSIVHSSSPDTPVSTLLQRQREFETRYRGVETLVGRAESRQDALLHRDLVVHVRVPLLDLLHRRLLDLLDRKHAPVRLALGQKLRSRRSKKRQQDGEKRRNASRVRRAKRD